MRRQIGKLGYFLAIFLPFLAGFALAVPYAFSATPIEGYLKDPSSGYEINKYESVPLHLQRLIRRLTERLTEDTGTQDEDELAIGDAYHWLAHIEEEKAEREKAKDLLEQALAHYQQTRLRNSPRIFTPDCIKHVRLHLDMIKRGTTLSDHIRESHHGQSVATSQMAMALGALFARSGPNGRSPDPVVYQSCRGMIIVMGRVRRVPHPRSETQE